MAMWCWMRSTTVPPSKSFRENKVIGVCRNNSGGCRIISNYFVIVFDRPFTACGTWTPDSIKRIKARPNSWINTLARFKFKVKPGKPVSCKVASSYLSPVQAQRNLDREIGKRDFAAALKVADATWNETMNRLRVEGGTEEQHRTFWRRVSQPDFPAPFL